MLPGSGQHPVPPPQLVKLVCNVAVADATGGVCLLLPEAAGMDHLVAVMAALSKLPEDSRKLSRDLVERTFQPGQKVRVLPDGFVYKVAQPISYGGKNGYFLQYLDAKRGSGNGRFAVWGDDLKRLEPTERSRPLGPDRQEWSDAQPTSIDRLCGASTLGNHALLSNRVTLIGSMADLERFLGETTLLPKDHDDLVDAAVPLGAEFPWGSIDEDGTIYIEHPRATPGEPLIAATRNFVAARKASDAAPPGSKLFVSRWLEGCLQNLEALSRIAQRQRVIVIADGGSRDRVGPLKRDGWTVWEPTPAELLGDETPRHFGLRCVDVNFEAAHREQRCKIHFHSTTDHRLHECSRLLRDLGDAIDSMDPETDEILDDRVEDKVAELWSLFLEACGWLVVPESEHHDEYRSRLAETKLEIALLERVTAPEVINFLKQIVVELKVFLDTQPPGTTTPKGAALLEAIDRFQPAAVVFGGTREREHARQVLDGIIEAERIRAVTEPRVFGETERILGCSLMARKAFARFMDPCPASDITLVAYDFEQEIYSGRLKRRGSIRQAYSPDLETRKRLTGLQLPSNPLPGPQFERVPDEVELEKGIERIAATRLKPTFSLPTATGESEHTREGRLCRFAGCSWAVFTSGHSISVVSHGSSGNIERRGVEELHSGDRLLIREAGDKDVIRLLAEDDIGPGVYATLWEQGQCWREALKRISTDPMTLWRKLATFGLHRDPVTVRYWLLDDGVIGPRSYEDIALIVEASGGKPDADIWAKCWDSIIQLRSLHMRAGMRLTKVLEEECSDHLFDDFEHEQPVQLSLGLLWLVRVAEIQPLAHWPANQVNQLHWGRVDWREQMLREVLTPEET